MLREFVESFENTRRSRRERPQVQSYARAITETIPNPYGEQMERQGGLAYPYPGRNAAGEQ